MMVSVCLWWAGHPSSCKHLQAAGPAATAAPSAKRVTQSMTSACTLHLPMPACTLTLVADNQLCLHKKAIHRTYRKPQEHVCACYSLFECAQWSVHGHLCQVVVRVSQVLAPSIHHTLQERSLSNKVVCSVDLIVSMLLQLGSDSSWFSQVLTPSVHHTLQRDHKPCSGPITNFQRACVNQVPMPSCQTLAVVVNFESSVKILGVLFHPLGHTQGPAVTLHHKPK
jgi:hypothetical protein